MGRRVDIKTILTDPKQRRELVIRCIIATQAREGITTTREQAEYAYDRVQAELLNFAPRGGGFTALAWAPLAARPVAAGAIPPSRKLGAPCRGLPLARAV